MSTSRIAVVLVAATLVTLPLVATPIAAQFVTPSQLYEPGLTLTPHADWGSVCIWSGQESDGTVIYGWESERQCGTGTMTAFGYDFNADTKYDVVVWPARDPNCGTQIRAWQWFVNGQWTEYVTGSCIWQQNAQQWAFVYNYFSASNGGRCFGTLEFLKNRMFENKKVADDALANYNSNRLTAKMAWHNYNQSFLAYTACRNQGGS
jgi:hypothetical protein